MVFSVLEVVHRLPDGRDDLLLIVLLFPRDDGKQPVVSEKFLGGILRFGHAVGVEHELVARLELCALFAVTHQSSSAEDKIRLVAQKFRLAALADEHREIVTGIGIGQRACRQVEDTDPAGHKKLGGIGTLQIAVRQLKGLVGGVVHARVDLDQRFGQRHEHRRRHAVTGHVADHDSQMRLVDRKVIVEIAADLRCRRHVRIDRIGIVVGKIGG